MLTYLELLLKNKCDKPGIRLQDVTMHFLSNKSLNQLPSHFFEAEMFISVLCFVDNLTEDRSNNLILAKTVWISTKIYIEIFVLADIRSDVKKNRSVNDVLMQVPYNHAKAKNMKTFSPEEVNSASGLEKKQQEFWNEKAEQLAQTRLSED